KKYLQKAVDLTFTQGTDFSHLEKRKGIWYRENEETPYTGKCIGYFNSGERGLSGSYQDGQRSGHWIYWYRNGQKKMEGNFISGRSHGKLSYWYEDGIVKVDARYYLGKIDGHNRYFYKNGSLAKETWYENGKPMGWIIYNKRGKITERFGELGKNDSR
ncbi:MAG: hypothetical protein KJ607_00620, partial [Bacteroidetes bacterium]|nr:hypothetical protein [Bacteroidota bacterium]